MIEPRIPLFGAGQIPEAQRDVFEKIVSGPRGTLVGPLRAALHNPSLADRWQALGQVLRYETCLPPKLNELAILVTGRHWNSELEWTIHCGEARNAGLAEAIIAKIHACEAPEFEDEDERWVYEFARDLLRRGHVGDSIYGKILQRWGDTGVVELTALVGYYTMVALTLNAHRIPLPATIPPELNSTEMEQARLASTLPNAQ